ncbi:hypothetical protein PsYK624_076900 [Phanerochaete sordida]|uniref:Uncharacterized protein n=1 Tax=Phanerochaete sordida TaxID=48140 RepID=A0A9P3LDR7_9APHY|nr:hypothetical protein PsYK624_076900 [Phanerochaete sordida]
MSMITFDQSDEAIAWNIASAHTTVKNLVTPARHEREHDTSIKVLYASAETFFRVLYRRLSATITLRLLSSPSVNKISTSTDTSNSDMISPFIKTLSAQGLN